MAGMEPVVASGPVSAVSDPELGTDELLFRCAQQMGLCPVRLAPRNVFAVTIDGQERYINLARSPLNSATSVALAKNKYVTRCILERHGLPNIPFKLTESLADAISFLNEHRIIIAKPVSGSGARDIRIITKQAQLAEFHIRNYILEKYIPGKELRCLLINGKVIGVHQSEYGASVAEDRQLKRISYMQDNWDETIILMSQTVANILNLGFVAVDFMIDDLGRIYVLEVNTLPGLKWFHAPTSGPIVDVARLFLESVVESMSLNSRRSPGTVMQAYTGEYNRPADMLT